MAGLLDLFGDSPEDPRSMAILAAGQGLLSQRGMRGLLSGAQGYVGAMAQAKERERQLAAEKLKQELLREQIAETRAQAAQRMALAERERQAAAADTQYASNVRNAATTPQAALAGGGGPTLANANKLGQVDWNSLLLQNPLRTEQIDKLRAAMDAARNYGKDEIVREVAGTLPSSNMPATLLYGKYGMVGDPIPKAVELKPQDRGGSIDLLNPFSGVFSGGVKKTMTPGDEEQKKIGWANVGVSRDRLNWDKTKPDQTQPLVQIVDPITKLPTWVERKDAVGKMPAGSGTAFEAKELGKKDLDVEVARLKSTYDQLHAAGGIISTGRGGIDNVGSFAATTGPGQVAGRMFGTVNQKNRDVINMSRPLLLSSIMKATGMSSRQLDSNRELQLWLDAATDPSKGYEANMEALNNIATKYGSGPIVDQGSGWGIKRLGGG